VAAVGLKETTTGDTLCNEDHPLILEAMEFPEPVISMAIEPKAKGEQEKMDQGLYRLSMEDLRSVVTRIRKRASASSPGWGNFTWRSS